VGENGKAGRDPGYAPGETAAGGDTKEARDREGGSTKRSGRQGRGRGEQFQRTRAIARERAAQRGRNPPTTAAPIGQRGRTAASRTRAGSRVGTQRRAESGGCVGRQKVKCRKTGADQGKPKRVHQKEKSWDGR